jgi:hypothetical protein
VQSVLPKLYQIEKAFSIGGEFHGPPKTAAYQRVNDAKILSLIGAGEFNLYE